MRRIANVFGHADVKRIMIYDTEDGCYIFVYSQLEDGSSDGDYLQDTLQIAIDMCREDYQVRDEDWVDIDDPLPDCQHDWISPVRVIGRVMGKPQWGSLERFSGDEWIPVADTTQEKN